MRVATLGLTALLGLLSAGVQAQVNVGHGGAWFNPQTPGQGLLVEVLPDDELFVAWFTYRQSDAAKVGAEGQRWLTAQGTISGDEAVLTLYQTAGGVFDSPAAPSTMAVGSAVMRFVSCTSATFEYVLDAGPAGEMELVRIGTGSYCQALDAQ